MIKKIAHVCTLSKDLAKSEQFYCTILGIPKKFSFVKNGIATGLYLEAGPGNFIEIFEDKNLVPVKGSITHLCLEVDNIDTIIAQIKKHGWPVGEKSFGADKSWQVWVKDPDGVDIEFHQYTNESLQITGKDCPVTW